MIRFNLRLRIAAAIVAVCIGIVAALGAALYIGSEKLESALAGQMLSEQLDFLVEQTKLGSGVVQPPGPYLQYYVVRTSDDETRLPPYLRGLSPGYHEIDIGEGRGDRYIGVRQENATRYVVVRDIGAYEDHEMEFKRLMVTALFAVVAVALICGYWLGSVLTKQLSDLAHRVAAFAPEGSGVSFATRGQDAEVAMLAGALDEYQARIRRLIRREQEFSANASHELRTPLTAIRTSCELLRTDTALSANARDRLEYIQRATDQMTGHIQALLFLAREQCPADCELVTLSECVRDAAASLLGEIAEKGLAFEAGVSEQATVVANRQALHIVLANIIRNAVRYTERGFVRITYDAPQLRVSDSGAGIPAHQITQIFERNYRGDRRANGSGIGLDIVKRVCEQTGWTVEVDSVPNVGSTFVITLTGAAA